MFDSWQESALLIGALIAFAFGCRSFENRFVQKLGWLCLLGASYLVGLQLSGGSHWLGATCVGAWFLLPWLEIVGRVRQLRYPIKSEVKNRFPPSRDVFPDLGALTEEAEEEGFAKIEDTGWVWDDTDHFMRLFYHEELRTQAAISLAQQDGFAFSYVSLTSRTEDGLSITTSNYPFSLTMKLSPQQLMNRCLGAESMAALVESHEAYLGKNQISNEELAQQDTERLHWYVERDMISQINHNISVHIIEPIGNDLFRYSWRGCFYLWFQVVKDMIRI